MSAEQVKPKLLKCRQRLSGWRLADIGLLLQLEPSECLYELGHVRTEVFSLVVESGKGFLTLTVYAAFDSSAQPVKLAADSDGFRGFVEVHSKKN